MVEHDDLVGERHRLDLVVGDVDHRRRQLLVELGELEPHLHAELGVEVGERLVEEEDLRVAHQRPADRDALALAAGELRGLAVDVARRAAGARATLSDFSAISRFGAPATSRLKPMFCRTVICG